MEPTLTEFVTALVVGAFLAVLLTTCLRRAREMRERRRLLASRRICRICLHAWSDTGGTSTSVCPRCGAVNRRMRGGLFGWNHDSALPS